MDLPTPTIGIEKQMKESTGGQQWPKSLEPCQGVIKVVQHSNAINQIKRPLAR